MLLTGKTCVVALSGPLQTRERDGRATGWSDVTRQRLSTAVRIAKKRDCPLYAPIKESEVRTFMRDLEIVCAWHVYPINRVIVETGAEHTLGNAWYALRFAYTFDYQTIIPVTSFWHGDRTKIAFAGLAQGIGVVLHRTVAVDVTHAGFSRRPHVRRFERDVMIPGEQVWKCEAERARVREYLKRLETQPMRNGFVPHPDALCPYAHEEGRIYQSVVEPARRVAAG